MMIVLVFISDGSSAAAGLVRSCGSSSSGQRSRIVTIGSDGIAAMLFAHVRKSSGVSGTEDEWTTIWDAPKWSFPAKPN
jgi:hypothetical protein